MIASTQWVTDIQHSDMETDVGAVLLFYSKLQTFVWLLLVYYCLLLGYFQVNLQSFLFPLTCNISGIYNNGLYTFSELYSWFDSSLLPFQFPYSASLKGSPDDIIFSGILTVGISFQDSNMLTKNVQKVMLGGRW